MMTYTNESHIKTVKDVETFFHHIVSERKVNFHPDDMLRIMFHAKVALTHSRLTNVPYIIDSWMKVLLSVKKKESIFMV